MPHAPHRVLHPPTPTRHRGRPRVAGLREGILHTAESIFTRRDYHEVLMDDVASAAHVSKGTLYRYFPSKRNLYVAVMFDGIERLQNEIQKAVAMPDVPLRKIECIVRCILTYFWDRRFFFALLHRNEHRPDDRDNRAWLRRRGELAGVIQRAVAEAIEAGDLRPIDPHIASELLLGMLRSVNRYRSSRDSLEAMVAIVVGVFLNGMAALPAHSTRGARRRA